MHHSEWVVSVSLENSEHIRNLQLLRWTWNRAKCFQIWCRSGRCGDCGCAWGPRWVGGRCVLRSSRWTARSGLWVEIARHIIIFSWHSTVFSELFHRQCDRRPPGWSLLFKRCCDVWPPRTFLLRWGRSRALAARSRAGSRLPRPFRLEFLWRRADWWRGWWPSWLWLSPEILGKPTEA